MFGYGRRGGLPLEGLPDDLASQQGGCFGNDATNRCRTNRELRESFVDAPVCFDFLEPGSSNSFVHKLGEFHEAYPLVQQVNRCCSMLGCGGQRCGYLVTIRQDLCYDGHRTGGLNTVQKLICRSNAI